VGGLTVAERLVQRHGETVSQFTDVLWTGDIITFVAS
jgi:hypothetical protein